MDNLRSKIIKGGVALSVSNMAARFLGVASSLFTIYLLSVYEYGVYKLVFASFGIFAAFRLAGLDALVVADASRFYGEKDERRLRRLFGEYALFETIINLILFGILFWGSVYVSKKFGAEIGGYLRIASFMFLAVPVDKVLGFIFSVNLEFKILAFFGIFEEIFKFLGIAVFGWWMEMGIAGIIWAVVVASFGRFVFFIPKGLNLSRGFFNTLEKQDNLEGISRHFSNSELVSLVVKHGKWGIATQYLGDLVGKGRYWLIRVFTSTEGVAFYALAESIYGQVFSFVPLYEVLFPVVPREIKNQRRLKQLFSFGIKYGTLAYAVMAVAAFIVVPIFLGLLFPRYLAAVPLFTIMIFTVLTAAAANVTASFFFAYQEQKPFFFLLLAQGVFIAGAGSAILWGWGITGAAILFVLAEFFYIGLRYLWLVRKYPYLGLNWKDLFEIKEEERAFWRDVLARSKLFLRPR